MYVHLVCGGCAVRGPRSVIGALTLVQSLLEMCLYDVCSLILMDPHTNQIEGSDQE